MAVTQSRPQAAAAAAFSLGSRTEVTGSEPDQTPRRLVWADLVRVVAICGVVLIHASAQTLLSRRAAVAHPDWWWAAHLYDAFARPAVPLFVMVSGALLLDPRREAAPGAFLRRRLPRLLVPLLFWSLLYLAWNVRYHEVRLGGALDIAKAILAGPVYTHLWFLYMLLGLYLLTPVLQPYLRAASRGNQLYLGGLWFTAVAAVPMLARPPFELKVGIQFEGVTAFLGYFVLGRTLAEAIPRLRSRALLPLAAAAWAAGYAVTVMGTYALTRPQGWKLDETYYALQAPNIVLMSLGAYVLLIRAGLALRHAGPWCGQLLAGLGRLAFGVYLLHLMVVEKIHWGALGWRLAVPSPVHPALTIPATAVLALGASAAATAGLLRVPLARRLVE